MKEDTCDKAIEILQATSDGDKLDPLDLKLVESAVNGFLSEEGIKVFNKLHETIVAGKYKHPWFHGIENMTIDHVGYIYWKGATVEHYEQLWAYSKEAKDLFKKGNNEEWETDATGTMGGHDTTFPKEEILKGVTFQMFDDDMNLYYEGKIVGDYDGFEPLDDFGMPNAGCTSIWYDGKRL